jgi:hypothetical protein
MKEYSNKQGHSSNLPTEGDLAHSTLGMTTLGVLSTFKFQATVHDITTHMRNSRVPQKMNTHTARTHIHTKKDMYVRKLQHENMLNN